MPSDPHPHGHAPAPEVIPAEVIPPEGTHNDGAPHSGTHRAGNHQARSVAAHLSAVMDLLAPLSVPGRTEQLALRDALGRGLAADVTAPVSLPPFANSQMDGFAVKSAVIPDGGAKLRVAAPVPAGAMPAPLERGTAAPIMTGAAIPAGADAVVPVERAVPDRFPDPGTDTTVWLPATAAGTFVRSVGSDLAAGERALAAGTYLGPAQLGLLAGLGLADVTVYKALTVLLVTTGDEVVEPGQDLPAGKIYNSNGTLLESAMRQAGLKVVRTRIATDSPGELHALLSSHAPSVDLIVTTGGVSMGAYEVVRQVLEGQGADFLHVAMQPGGPQGIGTFDGVPFLGFPGNPVSCLVSFEMFLRPVLSGLFGSPAPRTPVRARLAHGLSSPAHKHQVRRGSLQPDGTVRLEGGESSHLMHALAGSNALVHVPVGVSALAEGDEVEVWML
ncbi:gephyrin-like molybdotransferase Glp [Arthrobacter sp. S39]|uniref:molybdopterin molybdotransferase MoeA n=1 Tax=Arthrobacter sp. S39 TaxID=2509720 RepID=UPI001037C425|nr:gephyrin-like molybdotransferase Glp [Arthrobacter sp. S39]TAP44245.1 molybdopterin molybdenumtransferase MoeA [Arthrobacter sp. S39]